MLDEQQLFATYLTARVPVCRILKGRVLDNHKTPDLGDLSETTLMQLQGAEGTCPETNNSCIGEAVSRKTTSRRVAARSEYKAKLWALGAVFQEFFST